MRTNASVDDTRPTGRDPYGEVARAFDDLAEQHASPVRPARGYHRQIEALHRAIVRRGASVLEIGSGNGDLLAALAPSRASGSTSARGWSTLARSRHPGLRFEHAAGEDFDRRARRSTTSSSPTSSPTSTTCSALFRNVAAHAHPETRIVVHSYSQLWRPALALLELLRLKSTHADPELGRRRRTSATCSSSTGLEPVTDDAADPASRSDPVPLGVPERRTRRASGASGTSA